MSVILVMTLEDISFMHLLTLWSADTAFLTGDFRNRHPECHCKFYELRD